MELSISNISISLGAKKQRKLILDNVSFEVRSGMFVSLLGASGAGKSTLLKIVAGVLLQDEGSVAFDGTPIDDLPPHRRNIGFVFQDMRLFPNMNVGENVAFPCKMAGMRKADRAARADYLLERVQLAGFASREVKSLSGGQQQRVALARALAAKPQALLLDEPFSGLDENLRDDMRSLVLELQRETHITTLMVTHDAVEALAMSDRIVYMSGGHCIQDGLPQELYERPASVEVAACFGDCSTIAGSVRNGVFQVDGIKLVTPSVPDGPATAVIRYAGSSIETLERTEDDAAATSKTASTAAPNSDCVIGTAVAKACQYRGNHMIAHFDVDGQDLAILTDKSIAPGSLASINIAPNSAFVYPT